ncbi:MAG: hypothetical protein RLZZ435_1668 [Cyanobacteriota bacterium]|jgi:hypothetical protein
MPTGSVDSVCLFRVWVFRFSGNANLRLVETLVALTLESEWRDRLIGLTASTVFYDPCKGCAAG